MSKTEVHALTSAHWDDLAALFGPSGADGGCWDMFWRMRPKDYAASNPELNREALRVLASRGCWPTWMERRSDGVRLGRAAITG
jgi:hypothetical protein